MYRSSRNHYLAVAPDIGISSVNSEDGVVLSDGRAQQQRAVLSELQSQPGQKSRVLVKQSEFAGAKRLDIAKSIENSEHVSLFQNPRTHIHASGRGTNVKLVPDTNHFSPGHYAASETSWFFAMRRSNCCT